MIKLPDTTVDKIYSLHELRAESAEPREYLGGSIIGQECSRRIWYSFRHVLKEKHEGRILRLFETGNREEARLIDELRSIGVTVLDKDPNTGKQWRFHSIDGHFSGGLDGVVIGLPEAPKTHHLLEIKTASEKRFNEFEKNGVEKASPEYYTQVQAYMGMAELTRCAFFVVCKNDDRIYFERINFDDKAFKEIKLKAARIIRASTPPDKISQDPSFYKCKFCPFADLCHGEKIPQKNCRTCVHSEPIEDGKWSCTMMNDMSKDCEQHIFNPALLENWAEPLDGDTTWIFYKIKKSGVEFVNCAASGFPAKDMPHYSSKELSNTVPQNIGNKAIESARHILGGEIVETVEL